MKEWMLTAMPLQSDSKTRKNECNTSGSSVHGSAPPLTAEAASLIEKVTPALRSHIRGFERDED